MTPDGPVAVVTGASRGIGRATAVRLAASGFRVVVGYRARADAADETVRLLADAGSEAVAVRGDVREAETGRRLVAAATERWGRLDAVVNNAGVSRDRRIGALSEDDWSAVIDVDLTGAFHVIRPAVDALAASPRGAIVNIASIVGLNGNAGQSNYAAAKGGLIALTKSLARELAPLGITVNAVAPGFVLTDMTLALDADVMAANLEATPLGRAGEPEDVAAAVAFFCSPDARFMTGAILPVDGGLGL